MDFLDLVKRCADGDPHAWRAFLGPFEAIGRRALRSFRLPPADVEDILSDVIATLYGGSLAQFRGGTNAELVGFLKAIVRNRALDVLKHRRRWKPADAAMEPIEQATAGVADDECVEFLWQDVARLRREDQELFLMKARGLKEREIAEQLGRPPGTIASQIARLLDRLRAGLRARGCA